jgi:hypothetical protein
MAVGERVSSAYVYIGFGAVGSALFVDIVALFVVGSVGSSLFFEQGILVAFESMLFALGSPLVVPITPACAVVTQLDLLLL